MTALSADKELKLGLGYPSIVGIAPKASTQFYAGALLASADGTGLAEPATDAASKHFIGVNKTNVLTKASGNDKIEVYQMGVFEFPIASAAATDIGKTAFVIDDGTVGLYATPTNKIPVGKIVEIVSSTAVRVRIDGYACGHGNALGDS